MAIVLPDEPLAVRLMNTIWADRSGVHDTLTTTANLIAWLRAVRPEAPVPRGSRDDLDQYRLLRDALRRLAALVTADTRASAVSSTPDIGRAVADVNDVARLAPTLPRLTFRGGDLRRSADPAAGSARGVLASIAIESINLLTGADRARLRACYAPGCVLYFVKDHPRREWCSVVCGNRARVARHYQRHRAPPTGD